MKKELKYILRSIFLTSAFAHSFSGNKNAFKEKHLNTSGVIFQLSSLSQKKKKKKRKMGEYHLDFFFVFGNMSLQKLFPNICQCNICQFLTESQEQPGWQPLQKCQDISHQNCLHFGVVGTILTLGVADFPNLRQTCELEAWNRMNK